MKDRVKEVCRLTIIGWLALVAMFMVILLSGCGSHKSNLREQSSINTTIDHVHKDSASTSQSIHKTESEESTEETEEVVIEYDTDKPIDPATGKPPVKSETKKTTKKEVGKQAEVTTDSKNSQTSTERASAKKEEDVVHVEVKQQDETTLPKQVEGLLWSLAALAGVVIAGWLVYMWRKK